MSLDQPASSKALWDIYNATGARPEFVIPVLSFESGLNPGSSNSLGYSGLNGINSAFLQARGIDPSAYLTWPASQQLEQVVLPYLQGVASIYGGFTSGIRVYQANFYPASLRYAKGLDDVIVKSPDPAYTYNAIFDKAKKGWITPRDLGLAIASQLPHAGVQQGIAAAYQYAPQMGPPEDPVYGKGWRFGMASTIAIALGTLGVAGALAYYVDPELFKAPKRLLGLGARENPAELPAASEEAALRVQSFLFKRDEWTETQAKVWLREHKRKARLTAESEKYLRFRQERPENFDRDSFRTKVFGDGIRVVVGR